MTKPEDIIKESDSSPDVSGSVDLTENQISELAQIGSNHSYLGAMDECRISHGGIMQILKRYEEFRKTDPLDDENSEISKIGREIAEMSDQEFEDNLKKIETIFKRVKI